MRGYWTRSVSMELVVRYGCELENGYMIGSRGSVSVVAVLIGYQLPVGCLKVRSKQWSCHGAVCRTPWIILCTT